jgi:hypothetical protein
MRIEDINIGDKVVYIPRDLLMGDKSKMVKDENLGEVTSKNDTYVFVRYNGKTGSQATEPADLYSLKYRQDLQEKLKP